MATKATPQGPVHVLHPGDVACGNAGERFETLLGSCVAIVLTDPRRTVGAMCHFVHNHEGDRRAANAGAFANVAFERMFGMLRAKAIEPRLCEAYVYGGGNMFPQLFRRHHVGAGNVAWALEALGAAGIRVIESDVGGRGYRRLAWTVGPGAPEVRAVEV